MQKLGQHFLKNIEVLQTIVDALEVRKGDVLLEVGPGHGELTTPLVRAVGKFGGTITCIEKDRSLIPPLLALGKKEPPGLLTIIEGDALKLLPDVVRGLGGGPSTSSVRYKIAGNIPYYITGKLLRIIGDLDNRPECTVLLVQREVAERICAAPPAMNRLAASVQFWAEPSIVALVPRKDFFPPPDVDSAIILLQTISAAKDTRPAVDAELYYRAVRAIFAQPRKTLLNNLSAVAAGGGERMQAAKLLKEIGVAPDARPQDLAVSQIIAIARSSLWG
jgi:16S rRNA (adenine1518-N6/adenine1519-N6)-dimethyltransferase